MTPEQWTWLLCIGKCPFCPPCERPWWWVI